MNGFTRNFAGVAHPNAAVARRELDRQERSRLRRLSEVRPTPSSTAQSNASTSSRTRLRPSSAGRFSRPSSRPPSAQLCGQRHGDEREQFESLKSRVSSPERPSSGRARRSRSDTTTRMRTSFLLSPQRRLENAQVELQVSTEEQARALQEELKSWYFGSGEDFGAEAEIAANDFLAQTGTSVASSQGGGNGIDSGNESLAGGFMVGGCPWTTSADARSRPGVSALEEAAAAVKARTAASQAFGPPPPMPSSVGYGVAPGSYVSEREWYVPPHERAANAPGRSASGGCRGVAAATAYRQALAAASG